jgi:RNA polymerase sigma-70 factor (ECF subfamily)
MSTGGEGCEELLEGGVSPPIDSAALFREYSQFVASFLYRLGVRRADLEDMVQDVFMTAHRRGGYRPGVASPTTFLARLALEARCSALRQNSRFRRAHEELAAHAIIGSHPSTPEQAIAVQQAVQDLQDALDTMPPRTRAIFVLFELEAESCEVIAAAFGMKIGTVYSRLHSARALFQAHVARVQRRSAAETRLRARTPA